MPSSTKKPLGLTVITVPLPPASLNPSASLKVFISPYSPPPLRFTTVTDESGITSAPLTVIIDLPITVSASATLSIESEGWLNSLSFFFSDPA